MNLPYEPTVAVLKRLGDSGGTATHWLDTAAGSPGDTGKTRRFLKRLERVGFVEGIAASRSGRVFCWKRTEKGATFLKNAEGS